MSKPVPTRPDVDERAAVVHAEVQRAESRARALGPRVAHHHEVVGALGADLDPVASSGPRDTARPPSSRPRPRAPSSSPARTPPRPSSRSARDTAAARPRARRGAAASSAPPAAAAERRSPRPQGSRRGRATPAARTEARPMSVARVNRARSCRRWKLGRPASSGTTSSPSSTRSSYGSAVSERAISGNAAVRSWPFRVVSFPSPFSREARKRKPSSFSSNSHPGFVNGLSLDSASISSTSLRAQLPLRRAGLLQLIRQRRRRDSRRPSDPRPSFPTAPSPAGRPRRWP